jgi:hypothetical protein
LWYALTSPSLAALLFSSRMWHPDFAHHRPWTPTSLSSAPATLSSPTSLLHPRHPNHLNLAIPRLLPNLTVVNPPTSPALLSLWLLDEVCKEDDNTIQKVLRRRSRRDQIVQEIRSGSRAFELCEFVHEGRASNVDAHNLARSSFSFDTGRNVWFLDPPAGICNHAPLV